jgi:LSD1 subclass zinc finger protein
MSEPTPTLQHSADCGVCGTPLVYSTEPQTMRCALCGDERLADMYCPHGHYICDACHQREALEVIRLALANTVSTSPLEIAELVMAHPRVPMHGPEHHVLVPAALVAAARNAGWPVAPDALEQAFTRGARVPGGWCGYHGACGAAIGVGIAVSVLTQATPVKGRERSLAIRGTALALSSIADDQPRCCKRAVRLAIQAATEYLRAELGLVLDDTILPPCRHSGRNRECPLNDCPFYAEG